MSIAATQQDAVDRARRNDWGMTTTPLSALGQLAQMHAHVGSTIVTHLQPAPPAAVAPLPHDILNLGRNDAQGLPLQKVESPPRRDDEASSTLFLSAGDPAPPAQDAPLQGPDVALIAAANTIVDFGQWRKGGKKEDETLSFFEMESINPKYKCWARKKIDDGEDDNFSENMLAFLAFAESANNSPAWKDKLKAARKERKERRAATKRANNKTPPKLTRSNSGPGAVPIGNANPFNAEPPGDATPVRNQQPVQGPVPPSQHESTWVGAAPNRQQQPPVPASTPDHAATVPWAKYVEAYKQQRPHPHQQQQQKPAPDAALQLAPAIQTPAQAQPQAQMQAQESYADAQRYLELHAPQKSNNHAAALWVTEQQAQEDNLISTAQRQAQLATQAQQQQQLRAQAEAQVQAQAQLAATGLKLQAQAAAQEQARAQMQAQAQNQAAQHAQLQAQMQAQALAQTQGQQAQNQIQPSPIHVTLARQHERYYVAAAIDPTTTTAAAQARKLNAQYSKENNGDETKNTAKRSLFGSSSQTLSPHTGNGTTTLQTPPSLPNNIPMPVTSQPPNEADTTDVANLCAVIKSSTLPFASVHNALQYAAYLVKRAEDTDQLLEDMEALQKKLDETKEEAQALDKLQQQTMLRAQAAETGERNAMKDLRATQATPRNDPRGHHPRSDRVEMSESEYLHGKSTKYQSPSGRPTTNNDRTPYSRDNKSSAHTSYDARHQKQVTWGTHAPAPTRRDDHHAHNKQTSYKHQSGHRQNYQQNPNKRKGYE